MTHEMSTPAPKKPYEIYGLSEKELLFWRVSDERFQAILEDEQTIIHKIRPSSNNFGEFLFVTTSRPGEQGRVAMTFYGLGYHEYRERWITDEWFWYQSNYYPKEMEKQIPKEEARALLEARKEDIQPDLEKDTQTERGRLFEILADLTDEDGALAEMEDLGSMAIFLLVDPPQEDAPIPPTGENLLDQASREKLPPLYSQEEQGLDAVAQVKFFTPDSNWTWYASEFDGDDIFFGLVSGFRAGVGLFFAERNAGSERTFGIAD